MDDDQDQPVATETEEEHKVEEDGQVGPQKVVAGGVTRRHLGEVVVNVLPCCGFHFGDTERRICQRGEQERKKKKNKYVTHFKLRERLLETCFVLFCFNPSTLEKRSESRQMLVSQGKPS